MSVEVIRADIRLTVFVNWGRNECMQQIKFFTGSEANMAKVEAGINQWLATSGVRVINIFGNIAPQGPKTELDAITTANAAYAPSDIFIAVVYEK